MTCIVGLCDGKRVWMGGDAAAVESQTYITRARPKVFANREYVMGYTTSFRMGQLLEHSFVAPKPPADDDLDKFMGSIFVDAVRKMLRDHGWLKVENEREVGGTFLVGVRGRLFQIDDDFQALSTLEPFNSVGSGSPVALGAMFATQGMRPEKRILCALAAAEAFITSVRAPFTVIVGGLKGK